MRNKNRIKVVRKLRRAGQNGATIEVTTPKNAVKRELRKHGLKSIDEALAVWEYDAFDGILLKILPKDAVTHMIN